MFFGLCSICRTKIQKFILRSKKIARKVSLFRTILLISPAESVKKCDSTTLLNKNRTMELQGKVIAETQERSGTSARGEWKVKGYVIETHDSYPRKMMFEVFGEDRLRRFNIQIGQEVLVSFDIDAHEYNGRWFNSIRAFDVRQVDPASMGAAVGVQPAPATSAFAAPAAEAAPVGGADAPFPPAPEAGEGSQDDLPF